MLHPWSAPVFCLGDLLLQVSEKIQRIKRLELIKIGSPKFVQDIAVERRKQHLLMIPAVTIARRCAVCRS